MAFYNKKEQVLEIKLTQHGKRKLSEGKLKPVYYAFFDDDILYDAEHAGVNEHQNDTHDRIKDETPRLNVQYNFAGVGTTFNRISKLKRSGADIEEILQENMDKNLSLDKTLGTSDTNTNYNPSWNINFYKAPLSGSVGFVSGSYKTIRVPQLSSSIEFKSFIGYSSDIDADIKKEFEDDTAIIVEEDYILLEIDEKNTPFLSENFDIELFEVQTEQYKKISPMTTKEQLIPLSFVKKKKRRVFPILMDEEEQEPDVEIDPSFAEYFFDILVDNEIDKKVLCKALSQIKSKNILSDFVIDCEEQEEEADEVDFIEELDEEEEC